MEERERQSVNPDSKETVSKAEHEYQPDCNIESDDADKINVCSETFDPLTALYSPSAPPLPFPNIKCFNNVAEYESFLKGGRGRAKPENVVKKRSKAMKGVADPERIERLKKLMVNKPVSDSGEGGSGSKTRTRKQKPEKNVLTRMPLCKGSPLGELYHCIQERIRVKVHIRTFKGLRGVCSGFVVAFDKFWNMAMVDVDETYREPLFGEAIYHEKVLTVSRLFDKLNLQEGSGGDESIKNQEAKQPQPANPKAVAKSCSVQATSTRRAGRTAESKQSDATKSKQEKDITSKACQKKEFQKYGKVHTRHINQLFIRGENVILVNLQTL